MGLELSAGGFNLYNDRYEGWGNLQVPPGAPFLVAQTGLDLRWSPQFDFGGWAEWACSRCRPTAFRLYNWFYSEPLQLGQFSSTIDTEGITGSFVAPSQANPVVDVVATYGWASGEYSFAASWNSPQGLPEYGFG